MVLALIGLLVVIVGAAQAIVVAYYGSHARKSAHRAANNAQIANTQAYVTGQEVRQVKQMVNGQASVLLAHNQALEQTLLQHGITPPPPPDPATSAPDDPKEK